MHPRKEFYLPGIHLDSNMYVCVGVGGCVVRAYIHVCDGQRSTLDIISHTCSPSFLR